MTETDAMKIVPSQRIGLLVAVPTLMYLLGGCSPAEPKQPKSHKRDGVITRIDAPNKRVSMKVRDTKNPGKFLDIEIEGSVTSETEIEINGRRATIDDLRVDDQVEALGYEREINGKKEIVAEALTIERVGEPAPAEPAAAAAPASAPEVDVAPTPAQPKQGLTGREALVMMVELLKQHRQKFLTEKAELLKQGKSPDDPEVKDLDQKIAKAEQHIAQTEDIAARQGINLYETPASQPESSPATP
ncbi:MAG: hypothetical protein HUU22_09745 [Phycisphaerae bacterium]|nr:hypothetical protein [Phycisphaerae bacterium]NUQ46304.1 hypothetical protein [Phycisphaerae bacterium]